MTGHKLTNRKIALLIGINEYVDSHFSQLTAPTADVKGLANALTNPQVGAFTEVKVVQDFSLEAVQREIATLFWRKTKDDVVLLYFSGHAVLDMWGHLYLVLPSTDFALVSATAISTSFVKDRMHQSASRRQVVILDCCYSGAFERGTKGSTNPVGTIAVNEGTFGPTGFSQEILTSSTATQYAWEGDKLLKGHTKQSLFTHYLIKGLETGAAVAEDVGVITVEDLYRYVHHRVVTDSQYMTPQRWANRQQGSLIIAYNVNFAPGELPKNVRKQIGVLQLINAYRFRGHRQADLDPLRSYERPEVAELDPAFHGLETTEDADSVFNTGSLSGPTEATLSEIIQIVRETYCASVACEYMYISDTHQKRWIQLRLESGGAVPVLPLEKKRQILHKIIAASAFEEYLHAQYDGQERYSLEGGESLIPLLDELVQRAGEMGVEEIVIGMTHRGRLNVLVNTVGKRPAELFDEFEGKERHMRSSGDVIHNLGYSSDIGTSGGMVHVALAFNPSHLEIVDPVVEGSVRARQDGRNNSTRDSVIPILIHGDAAFVGQGVVMETFSLSQTRGYTTGGTVHIVINNQIGFTTSDALDSRSTLYCTDIGKAIQLPILHVNGDDPEAVVFTAQIALDYRMEFNKDVIIDLVCYRRYGHSEVEEPSATQPITYQRIGQHPGVRKLYTDKLLRERVIGPLEADEMATAYVESLKLDVVVAGQMLSNVERELRNNYGPFMDKHWRESVDTTITADKIRSLTKRLTTMPERFHGHDSWIQTREGTVLIEVKVPRLGDSVPNVTLLNWHREPGDRVRRGDRLIDLETDKVTFQVSAPEDGVLQEIVRHSGETTECGEVLAIIDIGRGKFDFKLCSSVERILEQRREMGLGKLAIDWGFAETLAYASLLDDGYPVRLSGQDSARGTFFHRHAVLHDQNTDENFVPLRHIRPGQASFLVIDSILSEEAVLGFEYGYSSAAPNALVIWEAQFGSFANGAQVVIDEFITTGEAKWGRYCGLVMFLPHGYDGMGPDQSSARVERYLQLCAEENIQVCIPSTPAQLFHLLRRQILRPYRKPLVVMTPKSLLRRAQSTSSLEELTDRGFQPVIDEMGRVNSNAVERIVFCSGKLYFDLFKARGNQQLERIAIVRIEQLYPFPTNEVKALLEHYPYVKEVAWAQEEPKNQGAWDYMRSERNLAGLISPHNLTYAGREYAASPATSYRELHLAEQQALTEDALGIEATT